MAKEKKKPDHPHGGPPGQQPPTPVEPPPTGVRTDVSVAVVAHGVVMANTWVMPAAGNALIPGVVTVTSTFQCLSVRAPYTHDVTGGLATAAIQYRVTGSGTWHDAFTPFIDRRATLGGVANPYVNEARGSIVGLVKNTSYDVQVIWSSPQGVTAQPAIVTVSTLTDSPPTGSGTSRSITNNTTMATALAAANPGDTLTWSTASYNDFTISRSGTAGAWIVLDGGGVATINGAGVTRNITISANYILLKNFILSASDFSGIVVSSGQHDLFIQDNTIQNVSALCLAGPTTTHYGDAGIDLGSSGANFYVLRNSITSTSLTSCVQVPPYDGPGEGISWGSLTTSVIQGNTVTGAFRDAVTADSSFFVNVNVDVADNIVSGYVDNGVEVKGGNLNVRVWGNVVTNDVGDNPFAMNTNTPDNAYGPLYVFRNTAYWPSSNTLGTSEYKPTMCPCFLFHNSVDSSAATVSAIDAYALPAAPDPSVVLNNIMRNRGSILRIGGALATLDYNCNQMTTASAYAYQWGPTAATYTTWADFRAATGQESHGLNVDPQFADTALHLGTTSPCKNAGVVLPNFNSLDSAWPYTGAAPDLGAYET